MNHGERGGRRVGEYIKVAEQAIHGIFLLPNLGMKWMEEMLKQR